MKNLGGEYLQLFSKNIVATFCHTFEKVVDPKKRISLFKLRQTWNAIIPVQKLIAIDKHVHSIDSGWPVMPEPPSTPQSPTIFVNPKFIKPNGELSTLKLESNEEEKDAESVREQTKDHETKQGSTTNIQEQRKALLEQQRQKRFEREKQMGLHTGEANISSSDTPLKSAIGGSKNTKVRPKRVRFIDEEQTDPVVKKVKDENNLEISTSQGQHSIATVESASDKQQTVTEETRSDEPVASNILEQVAKEPVNMSDLLSKLVKTGLLPQQQPMKLLPQQQPTELLPQQQPTVLLPQQHSTGLLPQQQPMGSVEATQGTSAPPTNTTQQVNSMDEHLPPAIRMNPTLRIPDLHLKIPHLKQFYPSLVDLLYAGEQCSQCGLRFTEVASSEYRNHLDWHFQLNRKDKDGLRKTSRNWFLHPDDWYALKEGEQIEDKVKSNIFEQEQLEEEQKDEDGNISCKVLPGEGIEVLLLFILLVNYFSMNRCVIYVEKHLNNFGKKIWKNGISRMRSGHLMAYCITVIAERRPRILKSQ